MLFRYHGSQDVVYITNDPLYQHHQHHHCSTMRVVYHQWLRLQPLLLPNRLPLLVMVSPQQGDTLCMVSGLDAEVADAIVSHLLGWWWWQLLCRPWSSWLISSGWQNKGESLIYHQFSSLSHNKEHTIGTKQTCTWNELKILNRWMNEWYTNSFMIDFAAAYELNKGACTQNSYSLLDRCS